MAHYLNLTPSLKSSKSGQRKKTLRRNLQAGPVTLGYIAVFLIATICLFYLLQVSSISAEGYKMGEIESEIADLQKENKNLQLEIDKESSLETIKENVGQVGEDKSSYVPTKAQDIKFIDKKDGQIAVR